MSFPLDSTTSSKHSVDTYLGHLLGAHFISDDEYQLFNVCEAISPPIVIETYHLLFRTLAGFNGSTQQRPLQLFSAPCQSIKYFQLTVVNHWKANE